MTESTRQIFEPEGRAIAYFDEGEGAPLVLLPGRGVDSLYLGTLASVLEEEGFRILRVGSRRASDDALTLHDLAQDVVDVMDHVGMGDAWVGGHAFGGVIARTVARDYSARVDGILLLAVEGEGHAPEQTDPALANARDAAVTAMQGRALAATADVDFEAVAPGLPVLVIQGSEDAVTPVANGAALQAASPQFISSATVEGAGHLFPVTHAGETAEYIEDFLGWD